MQQRIFGNTGWQVSAIGLGCWGISGDWGPVARDEAIQTIQRAYDLGVTFFDTADMYGHGQSEHLVREALGTHRQDIIIATKGGMNFYQGERHLDFHPDYIEFALEQSLKRLDTDYVDLYQLHNPRPEHLSDELFSLLTRLQEQGKIRHFGISLNSQYEGAEVLADKPLASVQTIFNLIDQRAATSVFPGARDTNMGVIARVPLASGRLSGKFSPTHRFATGDHRQKRSAEWVQEGIEATSRLAALARGDRSLTQVALQFVLAQSAVSITIPGAKSLQQVEENIAALTAPALTEEELAGLNNA